MIINLNNKQRKYSCKNLLGSMALWICFAPLFSSCNENVENLLTSEYPVPSISQENKAKVLWIVLDGANGEAVRQTYIQRKAENIRGMLDDAFYSFDGLANTENRLTTDSIAWNNLMVASNSTENIKKGQSILSLMKSQGRTTALFAADEKLHEQYEQHADAHYCGEDASVVDKAIASLSADDTKDFTIVELGGVKAAGEEYGYFDESNNTATPEMIQAIHVADTYVGSIMKTLKARKNYASENWLVMVTSNDGGIKDWDADNVYDRLDRKTFTVMYNQNINSKMLQRPSANDIPQYEFYTLRYSPVGKNKGAISATVNDANLFNFDFDPNEEDTSKVTNYTVQFMYRCFKSGGQTPSLVGKAVKRDPGKNEGWAIRRGGTYQQTFYGKYNGTEARSSDDAASYVDDTKWHVITYVFNFKKRLTYVYKDGQPCMKSSGPYKLDASLGIGDRQPLIAGKLYKGTASDTPFYLTNLQIYDVALPAEWLATNYNLTSLDKRKDTFEYWDHLIGYWPGDREEEFNGSVLHDYSKFGSIENGINSGKSDMVIDNPIWESGSAAEKNVSPLVSATYYQQVINTRDIAYQSLQWMGISINSDWKLSGIGRAFTYK